MITAKEARERTNKALEKRTIDEKKKVEEKMYETMKDPCNTSCHLDFKVSKDTLTWLESLEYTVETFSSGYKSPNGATTIYW